MSRKHPAGAIVLVCLFGALQTSAIAEEAKSKGAELYVTKACAGCHGMDGRSPILPVYPKVAGQPKAYLLNQMRDIKDGSRNNGQSIAMAGVMAGVSDEEIGILADWLSRQ